MSNENNGNAPAAGQQTTLTRDEWERRYAVRLMERGGMEERQAIQCGKDAAEEFVRGERAHGNADDATEAAAHLERVKHGC